jgi:hypothetical protein
MNKLNTEEVIDIIEDEIDYGNEIWEASSDSEHTPTEWVLYMEHYMNDMKRILSTQANPTADRNAMDQMRKVLAMGVRCAVQNGMPYRNRGKNENKLSDI